VNFKIKPSSQFSADLRAILNFISDDDASGARHVLSETSRKIELLKKRPLAFRLRPKLGQDFRAIRIFSYLLVVTQKIIPFSGPFGALVARS
jgi:plasmid stabilization system protein ParE